MRETKKGKREKEKGEGDWRRVREVLLKDLAAAQNAYKKFECTAAGLRVK